jgi:TonB family protein
MILLVFRLPVIEKKQGITIRLSTRNYPTFSVWNQICLHPNDANKTEIRLHEEAHVRQWHSLDRLFFDALKIVFWFNPFVFVLSRKSEHVRELLADQEVLAHQVEPQRYASLLVEAVAGFPLLLPVHNFSNKEGLSQRITCILNQKPTQNQTSMKITSLFTALVLAVSLWITACTENSLNLTEQPDVQPAFGQTTQTNLGQFLGQTLVYPESARKDGAEGRVIVEFVVTHSGALQQAQVIKSSGRSDLDAAAINAVSELKDWKPALKDGKPVSVKYTLPITFKL